MKKKKAIVKKATPKKAVPQKVKPVLPAFVAVKKLNCESKNSKTYTLNPITKKYALEIRKVTLGCTDFVQCKNCGKLSEELSAMYMNDGGYYYKCSNCNEYIFSMTGIK